MKLLILMSIIFYSEANSRFREFAGTDIPHTVYLRPGLASVFFFKNAVSEIRIGNPNYVKTVISSNKNNEVTVYLLSSSSQPTNVIVASGKDTYVIDIVPSNTQHFDIVKFQPDNPKGKVLQEIQLWP